MTSNRSDKVADLLKKEISLIITNEIKDIRLQNINITAVKVSGKTVYKEGLIG